MLLEVCQEVYKWSCLGHLLIHPPYVELHRIHHKQGRLLALWASLKFFLLICKCFCVGLSRDAAKGFVPGAAHSIPASLQG